MDICFRVLDQMFASISGGFDQSRFLLEAVISIGFEVWLENAGKTQSQSQFDASRPLLLVGGPHNGCDIGPT